MIDNRSVQRALKAAGFYTGEIDGAFGPKSIAAGRRQLAALPQITCSYSPSWPDDRVRVALDQWMIETQVKWDVGKIDGIAGARTQVGLEKWQDWITFERPPLSEAEILPVFKPVWPRQADVVKFYGEPGKNQVRLACPYPLYLDWDLSTRVDSYLCHEKVHDAAARVHARVLAHYGPAEIHRLGLDQFGGCLNVRPMRNGTTLSMHSWGIAWDWDADRNPLRASSKTARMATPPYAAFLDLWEEEGMISLGRARNYDWMHVQAARL